ncbi:MAG: Rpn family recombination-promoting nuclease/putative transposase [Firmicutes bacterium]|nr:Rpn family recombination-promoting nuclease/putative transposase [Bacillota bacterium]
MLNKILSREDDPIVNIQYKNPFNMKEYVDDKVSILDIKAETNNRELIDIEMLMNWYREMPLRLLYYHGGLLRESLQEGENYDKMKQTITICITDSVAFPKSKKFLNEFYLMEKDEHFKLTEITKMCCIELPKVNSNNRKTEVLSPLEICLEYLRCADENGSEYVDELIRRGGKELEMAQKILRKATEEEILRERAIAREKFLRDKLHAESYYERGLKAGIEQGRIEALKEIAGNLKKSGISTDVIAKNTGLTIEEINDL